MTDWQDGPRAAYLDLVTKVLAGSIYEDPPLPVFGVNTYDVGVRERGEDWPANAFTMVGLKRLANVRELTERAVRSNVPGDFVETGVWRGGASMMARAVFQTYSATDRKVILCDSFEGLPAPDVERYPQDEGLDFHEYPDLAVSMEQVKDNFAKLGLLDDQVVFIKGWFRDTMKIVPSRQIAVLRLDGDMYESTWDPLIELYDRIPAGGWVIVDDYQLIPAAKQAVDDFLKQRGVQPEIVPIDEIGVFFRKP